MHATPHSSRNHGVDFRSVYLRGVDCTLNYVENGNVATLARRCRHHDVFGLGMEHVFSGHKSHVSVTYSTTAVAKEKSRGIPFTHLQQSPHDIQRRRLAHRADLQSHRQIVQYKTQYMNNHQADNIAFAHHSIKRFLQPWTPR